MLIKKPFKKGMGPSITPYYKAAAPTYVGPGDIVSGAVAWGSPARAYSAAFAAGGTAIMDLVDQAGAHPITINILSTGFADLAAINAWVTANSVSTIKVTKIYDQAGGTSGWVQATLGNMPVLTLSAINGLPSLACVAANSTNMATTTTFTFSAPYTLSAVFKRTSVAANQYIGFLTAINLQGNGSANTVALTSTGTLVTIAAADNAFHASQGLFDPTASVVNVDGAEATGTAATLSPSATTSRIFRNSSGGESDAQLMEFGIWSLGFSGTQRTNMNANQHSAANGYNF